ncbi:SxtJ family membrane protein [Vibrio spartinae]|uniref:SxtJ family membrane protein n=1 Tax=Vibrio spartinae TaxID=1918945 RepID=UPI00094510EA|nr:SxtJ family membrane protein [Vibrio spartinae]
MRQNQHKNSNSDVNNLKLMSNQDFGFILSIIMLTLAGYLNADEVENLSTPLAFLGGSVAFVATIQPERLYKLNFLWTFTGLLLGKVTQTITLGLIFYLFFLPTGLVMRLCGKDELKLKQTQSYSFWCYRQQQRVPLEDTFKNQF